MPKDRDAFIGYFFPGASGEKLINALDDDKEEKEDSDEEVNSEDFNDSDSDDFNPFGSGSG